MTTLTIPAPADWITLNGSHGSPFAKARLVRTWRDAAAVHARAQRIPSFDVPVRIVATVHRAHNRGRWDVSNWVGTAKAAVDGLVDAGVLVDDSNRFVLGPDMRAGAPTDRAQLTLTITPVTEETP